MAKNARKPPAPSKPSFNLPVVLIVLGVATLACGVGASLLDGGPVRTLLIVLALLLAVVAGGSVGLVMGRQRRDVGGRGQTGGRR